MLGEGLFHLDQSKVPHKKFQPGAGPYGEPQLFGSIVQFVKQTYPVEFKGIRTSLRPDILIPERWAVECKIVRPYGDNGVIAEHWSQNLLHPYRGNTSSIGDIYKLLDLAGPEKKAVVVVTFSQAKPELDLEVIIKIFELIATEGLKLPISTRSEKKIKGLIHPVHQQATIYGWEVGIVD